MPLTAPRFTRPRVSATVQQRLELAMRRSPVMKLGEKHEAVTVVQQALIDLGYSIPDGATGYYGVQTEKAVRAFQQDNVGRHGAPDGQVANLTLQLLDERFQNKPAPAPVPPPAPPLPVTGVARAFIGPMGKQASKESVIFEYYSQCGYETVGPGQVEVGGMLTRYQTFEGLVDALATSNALHNVVINHGTAATALMLPLCKESRLRDDNGTIINSLARLAIEARKRGTLNMTDPDIKGSFNNVMRNAQITQAVVMRIVGKLAAMGRQPRIIHLRACNMKSDFYARAYKDAFGALALTYHAPHLLFWKLDPKIPINGESVRQLYQKLPSSTPTIRKRLFEDSLGEIATMMIVVALEENDLGVTVVQSSAQAIDRRGSADLIGWAEVIIRRWKSSPQKGFVVPILFEADGDLSFHLPMETGYREYIKIV